MAFSTELENNFKAHLEAQRPQMVTVIVSIKSSGGGTDVRLYYKDLKLKTAVYGHKNRYTNQWE